MSHSDIIIITSTLLFASTFGVYAVIKIINRVTRPPVNSLIRSGDIELVNYIEPTNSLVRTQDIELVDYIEPTQPQQIYNYPDSSFRIQIGRASCRERV